jgi:hypothetical protein
MIKIARRLTPVLLTLLISSCFPTRNLKTGESMLIKNSLKNNTSEIPDATLLSYVKQKPNKKILGIFRFHLWIYNRVNQENFYPRYAKRVEKRKALNERRLAAQKRAKSERTFLIPEVYYIHRCLDV